MGKLVDGKWVEGSVISSDNSGAYERTPRSFREQISDGHPRFPAESGRYHLYVSYACPWAHRTLIMRQLKGLDRHISVSVVHPDMLESGWSFAQDFAATTGDNLYGCKYLYEIYQKAQSDVSTSVTVPVLWDKKESTIINNESADIIRILNEGFASLTENTEDFYPKPLRPEIDQLNERIYEYVNNGVYRAGFAKTQAAYDEAVSHLFAMLDELDQRLKGHDYLIADQMTEADIRLITTLLRFDVVYATHFKCNVRRIRDYAELSRYRRQLYEHDAINQTTYFDHIKRHYFYSHEQINPYRIIPQGPAEPV